MAADAAAPKLASVAAPGSVAAPQAAAAAAAAAPASGAEKKDDKKAKSAAKAKKAGAAPKKGSHAKKWSIDCTEPVNDDIFDIAAFEKFLKERIKVAGKAGALGESVNVSRDNNSINVSARIQFSKRYLKYLTKKFLKQQQLRDYIRVIARQKSGYFLRYFNFANDEGEEGGDEK